jgi:hypothetical protein
MVPLTGGNWAEARTIAIGTVADERQTSDLSYLSRLCSAEVFTSLATLLTHERGTRRAGTVVAVMDGAPWLQELIDAQCPDAVRVPGTRVRVFPHAAEHLTRAAQAAFGEGTRQTGAWLDIWLHELKHGPPELVLAAIRALPTPTKEAAAVRTTVARYLEQRLEQIRYARFQE